MTSARMQTTSKLIFSIVAPCVWFLAVTGCQSTPVVKPRPVQDDPGDRRATREEEVTLIRADSEVFAAVVRAQIEGEDGAYPGHLERFRYDARPYGTDTGYPEVFAGVQGIDPTLTFARASQDAIEDLTANRRRILEAADVGEGGPLVYNQCAGARVPTPPPVRGSAARTRRADVHAGCPKEPEYYLTVGLPVRGQPDGLRDARDTHGDRVDLGGDVWTVLVTEFSASPRGWSRASYAWLFKRGRFSHRLDLANTILIGVVE
jgi:hypothetical protein